MHCRHILKSPIAATLLALMLAAIACNTTTRGPTENTTGGYVAPKDSPFYQTRGGQLYAWDGAKWFVLVHPETPMGGGNGVAECWRQVDGSRNQCWQRTPETFRDTSKPPKFVAGLNF